MKENTTEASRSAGALNQSDSFEMLKTFGRRLVTSLILPAVLGWLFVIIKNNFSVSTIAVFLGSLLSFFMFQIIAFFLNKFLEKELIFDEFSYVKQGICIVANNFVPFVLVPSTLHFFSMPGTVLNPTEELGFRMWMLTFKNPCYWISVGGLFAFFYRLKILKEKLTYLQSSFKLRKTDKEDAL